MNEGRGDLALYIEEERQQRASLFLRDVAYRLYAELELCSDEARAHPGKYLAMFSRRALAGQCVNQPYLGCREFAARFRLVPLSAQAPGVPNLASVQLPATEPAPVAWSTDLGWMLFDLDYARPGGPQPLFFRAQVNQGVIDWQGAEVRG
jgi:CRISPR-associated protein Cas5d